MKKVLLFILAGLVSASCATPQSPFKQEAFHHKTYPYMVEYQEDGNIVSDEWILDNYQLDQSGNPTETKKGSNYNVVLSLDTDGDGIPDGGGTDEEPLLYPTYDLRFTHARTDGVIWLRTLPYPSNFQKTELKVLMHRFAEAMSGAGYSAVSMGKHTQRNEITTSVTETSGVTRRYTTRILSSKEATVLGNEAFVAIIEKANLDQLDNTSANTREYLEVFLIRTDFIWHDGESPKPFPVLLLAGYSNLPEFFEQGRNDFRTLLNNLTDKPFQKLDKSLETKILECAPNKDRVRFRVRRPVVKGSNSSSVQVVSTDIVTKEEKKCFGEIFQRSCPNALMACPVIEGMHYIVDRKPASHRTKTHLPKLKLTDSTEPKTKPIVIETQPETEPAELTAEIVKLVVHKNQGSFKQCFENELKQKKLGSDKSYRVDFKMIVLRNGTVSNIELVDGGTKVESFNTCLKNELGNWIFPPIPDTTPVEFPFVFSPKKTIKL